MEQRGVRPNLKDDPWGQTALHYATREGHAATVTELVFSHNNRDGAETTVRDAEGLTPLYYALKNHARAVKNEDAAAQGCHSQIIGFLCPDLRVQQILCQCAEDGNESLASKIIQEGARVHGTGLPHRPQNVYDRYELLGKGHTRVLHIAAHHGHHNIVQLILKTFKEDPAQRQHGNHSVDAGEIDMQLFMNCRNEQRKTPLHLAAANGHVSVARYLIEHGARVNAQDNTGCTPLHYAVSRKHRPLVEFLLGCRADSYLTNLAGQTALEYARHQAELINVVRVQKEKAVNARAIQAEMDNNMGLAGGGGSDSDSSSDDEGGGGGGGHRGGHRGSGAAAQADLGATESKAHQAFRQLHGEEHPLSNAARRMKYFDDGTRRTAGGKLRGEMGFVYSSDSSDASDDDEAGGAGGRGEAESLDVLGLHALEKAEAKARAAREAEADRIAGLLGSVQARRQSRADEDKRREELKAKKELHLMESLLEDHMGGATVSGAVIWRQGDQSQAIRPASSAGHNNLKATPDGHHAQELKVARGFIARAMKVHIKRALTRAREQKAVNKESELEAQQLGKKHYAAWKKNQAKLKQMDAAQRLSKHRKGLDNPKKPMSPSRRRLLAARREMNSELSIFKRAGGLLGEATPAEQRWLISMEVEQMAERISTLRGFSRVFQKRAPSAGGAGAASLKAMVPKVAVTCAYREMGCSCSVLIPTKFANRKEYREGLQTLTKHETVECRFGKIARREIALLEELTAFQKSHSEINWSSHNWGQDMMRG